MAKGASFFPLTIPASVMSHGIMGVRQLVRLSGLPSSQPTAAKSPDCNLENHCVSGQRHSVSLSFIRGFPSLLSLSFSILAVGDSFWPRFCEWLGVGSRVAGCETTTLRCLPKRHLSAAACISVKSAFHHLMRSQRENVAGLSIS